MLEDDPNGNTQLKTEDIEPRWGPKHKGAQTLANFYSTGESNYEVNHFIVIRRLEVAHATAIEKLLGRTRDSAALINNVRTHNALRVLESISHVTWPICDYSLLTITHGRQSFHRIDNLVAPLSSDLIRV